MQDSPNSILCNPENKYLNFEIPKVHEVRSFQNMYYSNSIHQLLKKLICKHDILLPVVERQIVLP